MHVTCPNCSTVYNLPEELFKEGAKARCTVCSHVFLLQSAVSEQQAPVENDDKGLEDLLDGEPVSFNVDSKKTGKSKEKKKRKGGKLALILLLLFVLLGGSGAGVWFFAPGLLPESLMGEEELPKEEVAEEVLATEQVKNLTLSNIRQYYVKNEKLGQVFVIEGKVINNFTVPKELIKVEATLYDGNGAVLTSKQQLGGITVSLFQLKVLGRQEMEEALNNKIEILTNNTNIQPRQEVPFMVAIFNAPQNVAEFAVKVIEAKDPPKE